MNVRYPKAFMFGLLFELPELVEGSQPIAIPLIVHKRADS